MAHNKLVEHLSRLPDRKTSRKIKKKNLRFPRTNVRRDNNDIMIWFAFFEMFPSAAII